MKIDEIIGLILIVGTVAWSFVLKHSKTIREIFKWASELFPEAENVYHNLPNSNESKIQYVVEQIYKLIPVKYDAFISKKLVLTIAEEAYNVWKNTKKAKEIPVVVSDAKPVETPVINTPDEATVATDTVVVPAPTEVTPVVVPTEIATPVPTETDVK